MATEMLVSHDAVKKIVTVVRFINKSGGTAIGLEISKLIPARASQFGYEFDGIPGRWFLAAVGNPAADKATMDMEDYFESTLKAGYAAVTKAQAETIILAMNLQPATLGKFQLMAIEHGITLDLSPQP